MADGDGLTRREAVGRIAGVGLGLGLGLGLGGGAGRVAGAVGVDPLRRGAPELLIRGGRVVNADGALDADVRVVGETIAEVGKGLAPGAGARVIEAAGRWVLPGGIDPHTHPGAPFADDLTTASRAALAGGITTLGAFANAREGEGVVAALDRMGGVVAAEAVADVFLHGQAWPPDEAYRSALAELARRGQPSIKLYMVRPDWGARLDDVVRLFEAARAAGVVVVVHAEDAALLEAAARRLEAEGRTSLEHYAESRPELVEVAATQQALALCEATGAATYLVHLSSRRALEACREAKARGLPVFVETRPLYLHFTEERLERPDGRLLVGQPPLRTAADVEALWRGLADGAIDTLATDHAPWTREQKLDPELTIRRFRPGVANLQLMLPLYFSEGIVKGRITPERFVATTSANAARIFGLAGRKGAIRPGADADLAVWDPALERTVRQEDVLSRAGHTVYEGWRVTGWPVLTLRRGAVVYEDGRAAGDAGSGRLIAREPRAGGR